MKRIYEIMPEQFYSLDNNMSLDKLIKAKVSKEPLVAQVLRWDPILKDLTVSLGNGYLGYIPFDEISLYPVLFPDGNLSHSTYAILGKTILVYVLDITSDKIILSRKDIMIETFNLISNSIGKNIECCVSSFSSFGVFVDAGNGVSGMIHLQNLSEKKILRFSDIGINIGKKISAKILSVDDNKFHVNLNYKDQFENLVFTLKRNDLVKAILLNPINEQGYFASLNPVTQAVVDIPYYIHCRYGDKIIAKVKGPRTNHPDQLKLSFVSFDE